MIRLLRLLLAVFGTVVIVSFSVVNRGDVEVSFFPLPLPGITLPVYGILLFGVMLGTILGGFTLWLSMSPMRGEWRALRKRARAQERQERLAKEREEAEAAERSLQRREEAEAATARRDQSLLER
ncbi:MAG: LapA family protein [Geminicoccaceae bacterium]|nr:LapA family protein [Geminicoccaceae bacterium]MCB9944383.1 LapA family protein [Geminicoccaceae bacterium]